MEQGKILVVEDEESLRWVLKKALEDEGYWVQAVADGASARQWLRENRFDAALIDIKLPDIDGLTLLKESKEEGIDTSMILMTAQNTMRNAIEAMKNGAFDYVTKPFDLDEVLVLIQRALESRKLTRDFQELKEEVKKRFEPGTNIIGSSSAMQKVYKIMGQVVNTDATVLILGESGTGKELVAKTIHYNSPRWNKPFLAVHCAAIPRELLESELFGHEKGAFTGALERRIGKRIEHHVVAQLAGEDGREAEARAHPGCSYHEKGGVEVDRGADAQSGDDGAREEKLDHQRAKTGDADESPQKSRVFSGHFFAPHFLSKKLTAR